MVTLVCEIVQKRKYSKTVPESMYLVTFYH